MRRGQEIAKTNPLYAGNIEDFSMRREEARIGRGLAESKKQSHSLMQFAQAAARVGHRRWLNRDHLKVKKQSHLIRANAEIFVREPLRPSHRRGDRLKVRKQSHSATSKRIVLALQNDSREARND